MDFTAFLGIGSNLGDRKANCVQALTALKQNPAVSLRRVSSLYETEPLEYRPQGWFYNAVVEIDTSLSAHALLAFCQQVEKGLGKRVEVRKGPRTIDIDLLIFGDQVIQTPDLVVPHPMIPLRAFVLVPLSEIAPQLVHPVLGKTILELLAQIKQSQEIKKVAEEDWFPL
ncbi:MAG TPA: 2-amino-4-hydroxy-6-hydroxymethyldihydropteridine diphosphokinase [Nitrospiria bacterium]|nr:2-amino-4-hydroxy-6-hydroxymethyldihydropteridine diphosphokinase [Nitrospiria bacterium]